MSLDTVSPDSLQPDIAQLKLEESHDNDSPAYFENRAAEEEEKAAATNGSVSNGSTHVVRKLPFDKPSAVSTIPARYELSKEEHTKYDDVLAHMKGLKELPVSSNKKNTERRELSDLEKYWLSKECLLRYLRATKWNVAEAKKRLEGSIIWRREYGTDSLTPESIEPEVSLPDFLIPHRSFPQRWPVAFGGMLMLGIDWETNAFGIR